MRRRRFAIAVHTLDGLALIRIRASWACRCHHPGRTTQTPHLPGQSAPAPRLQVNAAVVGEPRRGGTRAARVLGCLRPPWCAVAPLVGLRPPAPGPPWCPPLLAPALCASHSAAGGGPTRPGLVVAGLRPAIGRPFAKGGFLQSSPAANLRKKRPFAKLAWAAVVAPGASGVLLGVGRGAPGRPLASVVPRPLGGARCSPMGNDCWLPQCINSKREVKGKPPQAVLRTLDLTLGVDDIIMPAGKKTQGGQRHDIHSQDAVQAAG